MLLRLDFSSGVPIYQQIRNQVVLSGLKERFFYHLKYECPNQMTAGMDRTAAKLSCSRRQLQRVVKELLEQGVLEKRGRGAYQLK